MALSIRLSRGGRKHRPFYRIVVADKRMPRDGRYIERLGTYNPLLDDQNSERVKLVEDRIKYWLSQGAKPSERVAIFLGKAGLVEMPKQPNRPNKSKPGEKAALLIADKEEKRAAAKEAEKAAKEEAKVAAAAAKEAAAEAAKAEKEAPAEEPKAEDAADAPKEEAPAEEAKAEEAPKTEDAAPVEEAKADDADKKAE